MFYFAVFATYKDEEVKDFFNVIQMFNEEIILISYDKLIDIYEVVIDVKIFGYDKFISQEEKRHYEKNNELQKYFDRITVEEYIEDYKNIYISDNDEFSKFYIYARNLKHNECFKFNGMTKRILEIVPTLEEKRELRIWNQQFKQYFKTDYSKFLKYCLNRNNWEISFKDPIIFEEDKELEILQFYNFKYQNNNKEIFYDYSDINYEEEDYYDDDNEENWDYDFYDDYYDGMEEAGIDIY